MMEQIGTVAGAIWQTLDAGGPITLAKLKKEISAESPIFDWAIGWLAREDKIEMARDKRVVRVWIKGRQPQRAQAA
jgi:hypothetical protein